MWVVEGDAHRHHCVYSEPTHKSPHECSCGSMLGVASPSSTPPQPVSGGSTFRGGSIAIAVGVTLLVVALIIGLQPRIAFDGTECGSYLSRRHNGYNDYLGMVCSESAFKHQIYFFGLVLLGIFCVGGGLYKNHERSHPGT